MIYNENNIDFITFIRSRGNLERIPCITLCWPYIYRDWRQSFCLALKKGASRYRVAILAVIESNTSIQRQLTIQKFVVR